MSETTPILLENQRLIRDLMFPMHLAKVPSFRMILKSLSCLKSLLINTVVFFEWLSRHERFPESRETMDSLPVAWETSGKPCYRLEGLSS